MKKPQNRILILVDGSERSLETVKYVSRFIPFRSMKVVLFHVFSDVPECYWDLEREPKSVKSVRHVRAWVSQKKKEINDYMEKAQQILIRGGFSKENVTVRIHSRKKGVARDVIHEAHKGYAAVVLRRRGTTLLPNIIMGSVATKLMERLTFVPIVIVGRKPMTDRVLIGFDGSDGCWRAVDFAGKILDGHGFGAHLVNVIRDARAWIPGEPNPSPVCPIAAEKEITPVLQQAREQLITAGLSAERVTLKVMTGVQSRAEALVEEAANEGCETIVVGRRGLSKVKEFFIGRVSNKVVHLGRKNTVWVVT